MNLKDLLTGFKKNFQELLTLIIVFLCFGMLTFIMLSKDSTNPHVAEIRTVVGNILILCLGYWFGSSNGSKKKEEQITKMMDNKE